jgi:serpin B
MNNPEAFDLAASTPAYTAVQLPYRGERFAALAIMPKGQPLTSYLATLTPSGIAGVAGALKPQAISLSLPKFTTRSTLGLDETLAALGMPSAFNPSAANFAEMTSQHVFVGQVLQRVYLAVAEKGTEAAAATGIGITASAAPAPGTPVVFDHPFLFLIRDTQTGAILFAAEVNDPTAG